MAEASFISCSRSKIYKLKQSGNKKAKIIHKLLQHKESVISTVLFGNNAVNIAAASIATLVAIDLVPQSSSIHQYGPVISSTILTFVVLVFGDILPKTLAVNNPDTITVSLAFLYSVLKKLLSPLVFVTNIIVSSILKIFGVKRSIVTSPVFELLRDEIDYHHKQGSFIKNDKDMLDGVLNLVEMDVESVMTHRKDCDMIDIQSSIEEIIEVINETAHTRIPVYNDSPDEMLGILHLKDFLVLLNSKKEITKENLKSILLTPMFVPLNIKLKTQLMEFKKKRSRIAIVVDEYGGMMGVVTLSDILEEIVGTMEDEHDEMEKNIIPEGPNSWIVSGECQIGDFNREVGSCFDLEKASTMAGIVIEKAGKLPEEGEEFYILDFKFSVVKKGIGKISLLRIEKVIKQEEEEDDDN